MAFYNISNLDIKMLYIVNEGSLDERWKEKLFVQTKFFADIRAKKYSNYMPDKDLSQEAYLGLWNAILSFDYQKNFDFYRWAQWNISKELRNYSSGNKRNYSAKSNIKKELGNYGCNDVLHNEEVQLEMIVFAKKIFSDSSCVLSTREKIIVADNLLLGKTLEEIAEPLSLSTERVRQIKNCGLSKLRSLLS